MNDDKDKVSAAIERAVQECSIERIQDLSFMSRSIALSNGMKALRRLMTDEVVNTIFMPLQGSRLGFRTDLDNAKDGPTSYGIEVVRDCAIEAMIHGAYPVGNEFNIIARQMYLTKEYFERVVLREYPGLESIDTYPGVPHIKEQSALVPYFGKWVRNGEAGELVCDIVKVKTEDGLELAVDRRIPVRVNRMMGLDAVLGKAKRKFLAKVYERLSGIAVPDDDALDTVGETLGQPAAPPAPSGAAAKTQALAEKHRRSKSNDLDDAEPRRPGED